MKPLIEEVADKSESEESDEEMEDVSIDLRPVTFELVN